jgi:hypothetical protein
MREILPREANRRIRQVHSSHASAAACEADQIDARAAAHFQHLAAREAIERDERQQVVELVEVILVEVLEEAGRPDRVRRDREIVDVRVSSRPGPARSASRPAQARSARPLTIMQGVSAVPRMIRDLEALTSRRFDVLVIGGGICGLMAAWDAATRGLKVALVDRHDLGSGASFHHHRTLHGGLRYLQKLDLARLRESARERRAWARMAPQFIEPQAFAIQAGGARGKSPGLMQAAFTADAVLTADRNRGLDSSLHLPRGTVVGYEDRASLDTGGLLPDGPIAVWHDYRTAHAERLTFAVARAAAEAGAVLPTTWTSSSCCATGMPSSARSFATASMPSAGRSTRESSSTPPAPRPDG